MEAVVLGAALAFSVAIAVAGAWSALSLVMYLIDVGTAITEAPAGSLITERAERWLTETPVLQEAPVTVRRSLAA